MKSLIATLGVLVLGLSVVGCKRHCAASVGACAPLPGANCSVELSCGDDVRRELKCQPPATGQSLMQCQCFENGVAGKSATVQAPLAEAEAMTACGW